MPTIAQIRASNAQISTSLPPGLIAVFAGATNGIGESALQQFAKNTVKPRIYFFGRSQEAGERVRASLQKINPDGEYIFKAVDLSLLSAVDEVSREIREKEKVVNLLFLSTGTLVTGKETTENLHLPFAVGFFARLRFITNLLPQLRAAATSNSLSRVVTVLAGTKEGPLLSLPPKPESKSTEHDLQLRAPSAPSLLSPRGRGHTVTLTTLALEAIAEEAPEVGFVHDFPGAVRSNLGRDLDGWGWKVALGVVHNVLYPVLGLAGVMVPVEEAGERQVYFGTSGRFPASATAGDGKYGVPVGEGVDVAVGTDGKVGSGVYSVTEAGESAGEKVVELLGGYRRDGTADAVWKWVKGEFVRITGEVSI